MALVKCIECGKEISDKAISCPYCGCPISNINNKTTEVTITSQPTQVENKNSVFGIVALCTAGLSLFLPYIVSIYIVPVAFVLAIVSIIKKEGKAGKIALILAIISTCWVIYVSTSITATLNGDKPLPIPGIQEQKSVKDIIEERTASLENGKLKLKGKLKIHSENGIEYAILFVYNNTNKRLSSVIAEFELKDGSGNIVGNTADIIQSLAPGATWKVKDMIYSPEVETVQLNNVKGIIDE